MKFIIYRNIRIFLIFASLTINAVDDANTKSSRFYTSNAKFASNSNKRRCFLFNEQSRKINKKIKFFWSFDFETSNDNDDEKTSKRCRSTSFEFSFAEKFCLLWTFFSALFSEIAILFNEMICKKSKTIETKANFLSITISTRKIFWVVFSTKAFKSEISKSRMLERKITKNEKNIETMNKRHLQKFEKKSKKTTLTDLSSMI